MGADPDPYDPLTNVHAERSIWKLTEPGPFTLLSFTLFPCGGLWLIAWCVLTARLHQAHGVAERNFFRPSANRNLVVADRHAACHFVGVRFSGFELPGEAHAWSSRQERPVNVNLVLAWLYVKPRKPTVREACIWRFVDVDRWRPENRYGVRAIYIQDGFLVVHLRFWCFAEIQCGVG